MVLKLYGSSTSSCTRRVAVVLKEKEVPYELVAVDILKNEQKDASFKSAQPFGQVPYIVEDDDFSLYESRAIGRYIALKYAGQGTKLIPDVSDLKKTALFEQAASIELTNFDGLVFGLAWEKKVKPRVGADLTAKLDEKLDAYEVILSKTKYLAGDDVTLADFFHLRYGSMLAVYGIDALTTSKRPNVQRWWNDISSRPGWLAVKDDA